jgi:CBS-domain-containing membrane protein
MPSQTNVVSFVLRFVQETTDIPSASSKEDWSGLIRHVQTDKEERFRCLIDAITFISRDVHLAEIETIIRAARSYAAEMTETLHAE